MEIPVKEEIIMTEKDEKNKKVIKEISLIYYVTCCHCNNLLASFIIAVFLVQLL